MNRDNLRKVICLNECGEEYLGWLHEWILYDGVKAIVEDIDGKVELVDYKDIQFKPLTSLEMF